MLLLLRSTFMVKLLLKREVGDYALNSHGNYIVDHGKSWKNHGIILLNFYVNPAKHKQHVHNVFISSGERMLEDFQSHLDKEDDRRDNADEKLQRSSKILVSVKAGVEHLSDKLYNLKAVSICTVVPTKSDSDVMFCLQSYQGLIIDSQRILPKNYVLTVKACRVWNILQWPSFLVIFCRKIVFMWNLEGQRSLSYAYIVKAFSMVL